jgi:hypothetical protein
MRIAGVQVENCDSLAHIVPPIFGDRRRAALFSRAAGDQATQVEAGPE